MSLVNYVRDTRVTVVSGVLCVTRVSGVNSYLGHGNSGQGFKVTWVRVAEVRVISFIGVRISW